MGFGSFISSLGGEIFSSAVNYDMTRKLQHDSQDFQADFYRNRHQWEVADLKKAGLNPILAANGGGSVAGGIGKVDGMDNPVVTSALVAKSNAEQKSLAQGIEESKSRAKHADASAEQARIASLEAAQRIKLLEQETNSASSQAILANIEAQRKLAEYKAADATELGKKWLPSMESLPSWMRGIARFGFSTASRLRGDIDGAVGKFKAAEVSQIRKNTEAKNAAGSAGLKREAERKQKHGKIVDDAVKHMKTMKGKWVVGSDGGAHYVK